MKKTKGFTLIELLVVIAIIGLLSTLAVVALNNARAKSRDARRVSDAKQISTALELYYNDCSNYPTTLETYDGVGCDNGEEFGDYMANIPSDPGNETYAYAGVGTPPSTYTLTFITEGNVSGLTGTGAHTASPAGMQ